MPNARLAELDLRKLTDYCLSPAHPLGRHKARVFRAALGITKADARWLRRTILGEIGSRDARKLHQDEFGTRYAVDVEITRQERHAVVRTIWILADADSAPRFVTCWVF